MNGIDISNWQASLDVTKVPGDFVIIKATEGTTYCNPSMTKHYNQAVKAGKLTGFYHFAYGGVAKQEADFFVEMVYNYIGKSILVLDWEGDAMKNGVSYAKAFLDRVYERTGVRAFIYMSKSVTTQGWSSVAKNHPLWVAQYADMLPVYGYQENPWTDGKGYGAWDKPTIFQYTSRGQLAGYSGNLDLDKAYIDKKGWAAYASPSVMDEPPPDWKPDMTTDELALEVIDGKWGNGEKRKKLLTEAGYDYNLVQKKVNQILSDRDKAEIDKLAHEVIAGKWGNGATRVARLGLKYAAVQKRVNEILGVGT